MVDLVKLRTLVHDRVNELRSIDAIIQSETFTEIWNQGTEEQQMKIANAIDWFNKTALQQAIKEIKTNKLDTMNMIQLRALAKKRGLVGFMQMSKSTILSELSKLEGLDYD